MIGQTNIFLALMGTFCTLAPTIGLVYHRRARRLVEAPGVTEILARLQPVNTSLLHTFPREQADISGDWLDTAELFEGLGGLKGLESLAANCAVLIDLACYVQRWYPEALPVAEQLRLNAREFEWHLERLRGAAMRGNLRSAYPDYAHRAVALYCGMTRHVMELYQMTQVPGWASLQDAL